MKTRTQSPRPKSLVPPELKEQLKRLNSPAPEGVNVLAMVDAGEALERFRVALEVNPIPLTLNIAKKICNGLRRPLLRQPRKLRYSISYGEQTIRAASGVLIQLAKAVSRSTAEPEPQIPRPAKQKPQNLGSLVSLSLNGLVLLCEKASEASSWRHCVEYASAVSDLTKRSTKDVLENSSFLTIKQGLISGLAGSLRQGRIDEAASIFASVRARMSSRAGLPSPPSLRRRAPEN